MQTTPKGILVVLVSFLFFFLPFTSVAETVTESEPTSPPPYLVKISPGKDSIVKVSNPKISIEVKDDFEDLVASSASLQLNGEVVPATFNFKGYWETDYYGETTYVVTSYKEGTITYTPSGLKDGLQNITVSISNVGGGQLTDSWSFTVAEPPKFSNLTPANKSQQNELSVVSAIVKDNTDIDLTSIKLKLNSSIVTHVYDSATGLISSNSTLSSGNYTATLEAKDLAGNLGTLTWSFIVDGDPPALSNLQHFYEGMNITDGKLKFSATLNDLVDIKNNVALLLNNEPLNITLTYAGYYDYYGDYIITSRKEAYIDYEGVVYDGSYTLTLLAEDALGNKLTKNWNFTAKSKAVVSNLSPTQYGLTNLTPTITATIKKPLGLVSSDSLVLKLNDMVVAHNYDPNTGVLTYTPTDALQNESYYSVTLIVNDDPNNPATYSWKFYLTTYLDMADSNINNCTPCHQLTEFTGSNGDFESIHGAKLTFGGTHSSNRCENCHTYVSVTAGCSQCHGDESEGYVYAPHGSTPSLKYQAQNTIENFPVRIKDNRELWDCIICHQPGAKTLGYYDFMSKPTRPLNNHDIPELHKSSTTGCEKCHAKALTREHYREGRLDQNEQPITCNTCHKSVDSKVTTAITNKNTDCSACHVTANHDELHISTLGTECFSCHDKALTTEHSARGFDCQTCHESTTKEYQNAILWKQKDCSNCHSSAHGVTLTKDIPAEIPLYPNLNLKWMKPVEIDYWLGESWVPEEAAGGLITQSTRADLNLTLVKDYYLNELVAAGWTKTSEGYTENKFEIVFAKDSKLLWVRGYNTERYNTETPLVEGPKLEIIFK